MGNYIIFKSDNNYVQIEGVDKELQRKTLKRIEETLKQHNGILCSLCKVALMPISKNVCSFPFHCNVCSNSINISGSYGILDFLNEEDIWLPYAVSNGLINIKLTN